MIEKQFNKWLFSNPARTTTEKAYNIMLVLVFYSFYSKILVTFLKGIYPEPLDLIGDAKMLLWTYFWTCVVAPLWEELFFRVGPISIAKKLGRHYYFPIILMSSIFFGYMHGFHPLGIILQGVFGFLASVLYIKNGNCYISVVLAHFLWNFHVTFLQ